MSLRDDTLTLKGEKKSEREEKEKDYHLSERSYGTFERSFRLPDDVDTKRIDATFSKGVLRVTLLRTPASKVKVRGIGIKSNYASRHRVTG